MPRFAANLSTMFGEYPFLDRFARAAEAGFTLVEFQFAYDWPPAGIARAAEAASVEVVLLNAPRGNPDAGERGLAVQPDDARFDESIGQAIELADATGARLIHVMSGIGDAGDPATMASLCERLTRAADRIGAAGRRMVIEPINAHDMPGYVLNDFEQAAALIAKMDHPAIGLLFDLYHRQRMAGEVLRGLERHLPHVAHVQIAGAPDRHEPDTGELDHVRVLRHLDALGYAGVVGCEYFPATTTEAGLGWFREWRD